ncbi:hypothetical protein [Haliea sp. E17]|uniref:hypothetical protein n=1 Tax=Haliea sp. E17 TaxID=3401576 RepID=UPI003AAB4D50
MRSSRRLVALFGLLAWLGMVGLSAWYAPRHYIALLEQQLDGSLVDALINARVSQVSLLEGWEHLAAQVNSDLGHLPAAGRWSALRECRGRVLRVQQQEFAPPGKARVMVLGRDIGAASMELALGISCSRNWTHILLGQGLLALAGMSVLLCLPRPLSTTQRQWLARLVEGGCPRRRALVLARSVDSFSPTQHALLGILLEADAMQARCDPEAAVEFALDAADCALSAGQLAWFRCALRLHPGDWQQALGVAQSRPDLTFFPAERAVRIHGIELKLPSTPFFYYYWYANRRAAGTEEGWFLNPSSNRPDLESAAGLVHLMEAESGHARAINELADKGLRAKVLDQNRSKVKDNLTALLGEELSAAYLFEDSRDTRTGRSRYRLALEPDKIVLSAA